MYNLQRIIAQGIIAALVTGSVAVAQNPVLNSPDGIVMESRSSNGGTEINMGYWTITADSPLGAFIVAENERLSFHIADINMLEAELAEVRQAKKASVQARMDPLLWFTKAGRNHLRLHKKMIAASIEYEIAILDIMHDRHVTYYEERDDRVLDMAHKHHNAYYTVEEWAAMISSAIEGGRWLKTNL